MDPSSPIEKHFVFPPILYAGSHLLSIITRYKANTESKEEPRKDKVESRVELILEFVTVLARM
jgi:hypothetical protein